MKENSNKSDKSDIRLPETEKKTAHKNNLYETENLMMVETGLNELIRFDELENK